ncbi:hypothetical protein E1301_Tti022455 [Triplophysa tibetana]|uniref:Uncharacterized protein n=1 Tax=Triplophysa tibetana TaxID=1572043 RepID=A0A5A9NB51_9TELE|nr:hypothetical protein E1301_Tti022455 [Triplophysa tibetana]
MTALYQICRLWGGCLCFTHHGGPPGFQAQLLSSLEGGRTSSGSRTVLRRDLKVNGATTDFALMSTKRIAQAIGRTMGLMVGLHRHLWLTHTDLKKANKRALLNPPLSPSGLFGWAVDAVIQRFTEDLKRLRPMR